MTEQRQFSRITISIALDGPDGPRLEQITREHIQLARKLMDNSGRYDDGDRRLLRGRIDELRTERDAILRQYEEFPVPRSNMADELMQLSMVELVETFNENIRKAAVEFLEGFAAKQAVISGGDVLDVEGNDIAGMFSDLCEKSSIEVLQSIKRDLADWEGGFLAEKIKATVDRHLEKKLSNKEKTAIEPAKVSR